MFFGSRGKLIFVKWFKARIKLFKTFTDSFSRFTQITARTEITIYNHTFCMPASVRVEMDFYLKGNVRENLKKPQDIESIKESTID